MEASKELVDEFKPVLKELNLSQEKAQALIDFYTAKVLPGMQSKGLEVWNNELAARQQAIEKDPEIGGEKLKATGETINRVANTFLKPDETAELMEYSKRFGDCPAFVKLLTRVGGAMKDDGVVMAGAGGESSAKSLAERLYDGK
jgi:3-oxoacyl-ACP reductase-like protein